MCALNTCYDLFLDIKTYFLFPDKVTNTKYSDILLVFS